MGDASKSQNVANAVDNDEVIFVSRRDECVEKRVVWKIENFSMFLTQSRWDMEQKGIIFEAGHCRLEDGTWGQITWKYFLGLNKNNLLEGYLRLQTDSDTDWSTPTSTKVWQSVTLSSGGETIKESLNSGDNLIDLDDLVQTSLWGWSNIASRSEILRKTRGTDSLEVTLELKVFSNPDFNPVRKKSPSPSETIFFVSGLEECVEKRVVWKIENLSDYLAQSKEDFERKRIIFEAGSCWLEDGTRSPATWEYHLKDEEDNFIGGYLLLRSPRSSATAWQSVTFSSGGETIRFLENSGRKDFEHQSNWGWDNFCSREDLLERTRGTDVLEVTLKLKVFFDPDFTPVLQKSDSPSTSRDQVEMEVLKEELTSDLQRILQTGNGTDVDVKVPNKSGEDLDNGSFYTKKAHRSILIARSSVFSTMFEQEMTEAEKGEVVIPDLSPTGLDVLLHFLYTGEVLEDWLQVPEEILNSSEKYDLGGLKKYCRDNLQSAVTASNALRLYDLAKLHELHVAKKAIAKYISENTEVVLDHRLMTTEEQALNLN